MAETGTCSPGEHDDRRNFTIDDYLQMVRDGEAEFSIAEAARVMGQSRAFIYRAILLASVPEDEFEAAMDATLANGLTSTTALADEIKRRTGKAIEYRITCPHCGGLLRTRRR